MELISYLAGLLLLTLGGIIVHLLANDVHAHALGLAKRIIRLAVRLLAPRQRKRYLEEWLSDLEERVGFVSKLVHAIGCVRCARQMRRLHSRKQWSKNVYRFEFENLGAVQVNQPTLIMIMHMMSVIAVLVPPSAKRFLGARIGAGIFLGGMIAFVKFRRAAAFLDFKQANKMFEFMQQGAHPKNMKFFVNGVERPGLPSKE